MMNPITRRLVTMLMLAFIFMSAYFLIGIVINVLVYFFGIQTAASIILWLFAFVLLFILAGILES